MGFIDRNLYVKQTKDYAQFKFFGTNRRAELRKDLVRSIGDVGQVQPIIVDKSLTIIDGQHRLLACQALDIPISYIVNEDAKEELITEVNSSQKAWTKVDYIERFATKGVPSFVTLKNLMAEHGLSASSTIVLLDDYAVKVSHADGRNIKSGLFEINDDSLNRFRYRIAFMKDFWGVSDGAFAAKFKTHRMMYALVRLVSHPNYNHEYWMTRLAENITDNQIKVPSKTSDCLVMIESLYNWRLLSKKKRVDLT
jgi:hypothetical protein